MSPTGPNPNWFERWVLDFIPSTANALKDLLGHGPDWLAYVLLGVIGGFLVVNLPALLTPGFIWIERKFVARVQHRVGPNRVGPFGLLQGVADAVKLMTKEDLVPDSADKLVFNLAPLMAAIPIFLVFPVIPYSAKATLADLNIGLLYIIAITSVTEVAIFAAGWSSNNKYALFGAMRAVAMLISYEIPLALSLMGVVLISGTMQLSVIVDTQRYMPMILLQPIGFLVFVTAVSAELNRTPFDLLEAESELTTGYHVEYSGMKWGVFMLAEYAAAFAYSFLIATLFFSGWKGPLLPGFVWLAIKVVFIWCVFIWVRGTFPRLRVDQVMAFSWKFLVPLSLMNVLITAVEVIIQANQGWEYFPMWFAPINVVIAIVLIVIMSKLFKFEGQTRQVLPSRMGNIIPVTQAAERAASKAK